MDVFAVKRPGWAPFSTYERGAPSAAERKGIIGLKDYEKALHGFNILPTFVVRSGRRFGR